MRARAFLLLIYACCALLLQGTVGAHTLYSQQRAEARLRLHAAILANDPGPGLTFEHLGAADTNKRRLIVAAAAAIAEATDLDVLGVYFLIDTVCLLAIFPLFHFFLARWLSPLECFAGTLWLAVALVPSYSYSYFHPWDRPSLLAWIGMAIALRDGRDFLLYGLLALAMLIKHDALLIPLLFLLANYGRRPALEVLSRASLLGALALGITAFLFHSYGSPGHGGPLALPVPPRHTFLDNYDDFLKLGFLYPPLLVHALPFALALAGFRTRPRFLKASVLVAFLSLAPYAFVVRFVEVRAQMYVFVLVLPAALLGLRSVLGGRALSPPEDPG